MSLCWVYWLHTTQGQAWQACHDAESAWQVWPGHGWARLGLARASLGLEGLVG